MRLFHRWLAVQPAVLSSTVPAGTTFRAQALASLGALVGIALTGAVGGLAFGQGLVLPLIVAPMGASAVLLFAVPSSPLAQPWSILGGNVISAVVGVAAAKLIGDPAVATGVAVGMAIAAMWACRCLHPPGGAAALTAALGGTAVGHWGWLFPFIPVGLNSCILLLWGVSFHWLTGTHYPHLGHLLQTARSRSRLRSQGEVTAQDSDIQLALRDLDETFDISLADLDSLVRQIEVNAALRTGRYIKCSEIMSCDVARVGIHDTTDHARQLLLLHDIGVLPVENEKLQVIGAVGLSQLASSPESLSDCVVKTTMASPDDPALGLLPQFMNERARAVLVQDKEKYLVGIITHAEMLACLLSLYASQNEQDFPPVAATAA